MNLTEMILSEMHAVEDWVSIADVLKVMGTTSFVADRGDVRRVLDCVDTSDRLRLGHVSNQFDEIAKPIPVTELVDRIFSEDGPADRSAAMMELFIDQIRSGGEPKEVAAKIRHTLDFGSPLPPGWTTLDNQDRYWDRFTDRFGFRPGTAQSTWPAIAEPTPSITFDLTVTADIAGAWRRRFDAVNAEALCCFVSEFPDDPMFAVLDWQHAGYRLDAAVHAAACDTEWQVPVYPNGDYYIFLRDDLSEGTFGHPWEQTLCVFGERLLGSLGCTLATWLPVKRIDGRRPDSA